MFPSATRAQNPGAFFKEFCERAMSLPTPLFLNIKGLARRLAALSLLAATAAQAQTANEPSTPAAVLPTQLHYEPVLADAAAAADPEPQGWIDANDRVDQIGGWRAYAKEVMTGVPAGEALVGQPAQPANASQAEMHMDMKGHKP